MCARARVPISLLIGPFDLASETSPGKDLQTLPFGNINLVPPSLTPPTIDLATRHDTDVSLLHPPIHRDAASKTD